MANDTLTGGSVGIFTIFGVPVRLLPMSDERVTTMIHTLTEDGVPVVFDFQQYWVQRGARDDVKEILFDGVEEAKPAPGVMHALHSADAILLCPSNPVVSIGPILAVPGVRRVIARLKEVVAGVSPIVGGSPLRGMADRLLPAWGVEVSAAGVAEHYRDVIGGWVIDVVDEAQAERIRALDLRVAATDSIMTDDAKAEALARVALELASA